MDSPNSINVSLRSKRFPNDTKEIRAAQKRLSHSGRARNGARAERWKERDGGGERRERLPASPPILKNPFAHERDSWLVRYGYFDWQVYLVRLNDSRNNSSVTCTIFVNVSAKIYSSWHGRYVFDFTQKTPSFRGKIFGGSITRWI